MFQSPMGLADEIAMDFYPSRQGETISMRTPRFSMLIVLAMLTSGVTAGIYKWKDKDGNVHFGDRPPAEVEKQAIKSKSPGAPTTDQVQIPLIGPKAAPRDTSDNSFEQQERIREVLRRLKEKQGTDDRRSSNLRSRTEVTPGKPQRPSDFDMPCANNACVNTDLKNKDFSTHVLSMVSLDGSDLSGARFKSADHVSFKSAKLIDADLTNADLNAVDFTDADLSNSKLSGMRCIHCKFDNAKLSGADLQNAVLLFSSLKNSDLQGARMSNAVLISVDLRDAEYSMPELLGSGGIRSLSDLQYSVDGCDTTEAAGHCHGAQLKGLQFGDIELENVNFSKADLSGADLTRIKKIDNVSFAGAEMSGSMLSGVQITDFRSTRFNGANLEGADLSGSEITAADFTGANLNNANLTGARLNPLAFDGAIIDGCNGCPGVSGGGVSADGRVMPGLDAIKVAFKNGWVIRETDSRQDIRQLFENRKIIEDFQAHYYLWNVNDLKQAVIATLQNDDADSILVGQKVIREYDRNAMSLGRAGLCKDQQIVQASLGLLDFDMPEAGKKKKRVTAGYTSDVQRIRMWAIECSNFAVYRDPSVQKQYIQRFNAENDPRVKGALLAGYTTEHAGQLLKVLPELLQHDSGGLARRAILRIARWDQPPQQTLDVLLSITGNEKPQKFSELIEALGARATMYLPALRQEMIRRDKSGISDDSYSNAIKVVERLSEAERLDYSFPTEQGRVMRLMHDAFNNILDSYHLAEVAEVAVFSKSREDIRGHLDTIAGGNRLDSGNILAIAAVAYEYRQQLDQAELQPRVGMKTIIFDSPLSAENGVKILQEQLASRRKLVIGGNAVHLIWWRHGLSVGNGEVVADQLKKIHSASSDL